MAASAFELPQDKRDNKRSRLLLTARMECHQGVVEVHLLNISHSGAKLAGSGFNDPTGNAAANAHLSTERAQHVAATLEAVGIPAEAITLEKPANATNGRPTLAEARRVEVTIRQ